MTEQEVIVIVGEKSVKDAMADNAQHVNCASSLNNNLIKYVGQSSAIDVDGDDVTVSAVYLFERNEWDEAEELDHLDWDAALKGFEIV